MNQPKKDGSQFESGFGGSVFGGATGLNSQAHNQPGSLGAGGGEFGNNSFAGTNAVSQIFKDANADDKKKKLINIALIGGCCIALIAFGYFFFMTETPAQDAVVVAPAVAAPAAATEEVVEEDALAEDEADVADAAPAAAPAVSGSGSQWAYNETTGGPVVTVAPGTVVEVSRLENFAGPYVSGKANGAGKFRIPAPPAGKVFWRQSGSAQVNTVEVTAPAALGISFSAPPTLDPGGTLSWTSSRAAAFYRVELATDAEFSSTSNTFSTKEQMAAIKDVSAGKYFVRVGGFNSNAGKWEWSRGSQIEVK